MDALTLHASAGEPIGRAPTAAGAAILQGDALRDIIAERMNQIAHGFTLEHDLFHTPQVIALGGTSYANTAIDQLHGIDHPREQAPDTWLFDDMWNPRADARANLVKGIAMLWAAIDRIDAAPRDTLDDQVA